MTAFDLFPIGVQKLMGADVCLKIRHYTAYEARAALRECRRLGVECSGFYKCSKCDCYHIR